jgi:apolipoprotein N-acyltransferase
VTGLALALLSAALYTACFPPFARTELVWIALVPAIAALDRGPSPARAALVGAVWGAATTAGVVAWLVPTFAGYFGRPWHQVAGLYALVCAGALAPYFAAAFALLAFARHRLSRTAWLFAVPAVWVAAELARTSLGLRSGWARLGDACWDAPVVRQIASLLGVYGVSALVALGNVALYEVGRAAVVRARCGRVALRPLLAVTAGALASLALTAAHARSARSAPRASEPAFEVLAVQAAVPPELRWKRAHATRVLRAHAERTSDALHASATAPDLVIWPENALQTAPDDPAFAATLRGFVSAMGAPLLLGAPRAEGGAAFNSAHLLTPDGGGAHYDKIRLLPLSETALVTGPAQPGDLEPASYTAGRAPGLFDVAGRRRIGVLICFEAIYPEMARTLAQGGATALVNLSNDGWYRGRGGARQHLQQAVLRAVETGLPLVRATTTGITAVIAPDGAIVAEIPPGEPGTLRAALPARRAGPTVYTRIGDVFAWACAGASALVALVAALSRSR